MSEGGVLDGVSRASGPSSRLNEGILACGEGITGVAFGVVSGESALSCFSSWSTLSSASCTETWSSSEGSEVGSGVLVGGLEVATVQELGG